MAAAAVTIDAVRPHTRRGPGGLAVGFALSLIILAPLLWQSWMRLQRTRAQLAEFGPDAAPPVDLWTAPGAPGVIGVMVVVAAVAAALTPSLLRA